MRPAACVTVVCAVLALLASADAKPKRAANAPDLIQVATPAGRATVTAHPDVNVVVRFPTARGGDSLADPATFRARLAGRDITDLFTPVIQGKKQVGVRAAIPREKVKLGRRRANRLRLLARARRADEKGRTAREIVRLRFRAVEGDNLPPTANIVPESEVVFPAVALGFDGSKSFDPESDALTYHWDFGDGGVASDVEVEHTYTDGGQARTVTLTVSDGQANASSQVRLRACPVPEGTTPGVLEIEADTTLEFGAVAPGASATRTFRVRNAATDETSVLATCIGLDGAGFSVSTERLDLRAQESAEVTLTFAPVAEGHAAATLAVVSPASNRQLVSLVAHGFGGSAPGPGPTLGSAPVFYTVFTREFVGVKGFLPSGAPITPDTGVHSCAVPGNGPGTGDACIADADCAPNGGTCPQSAVCPSGANVGQVCTQPGDCPFVTDPRNPSCSPATLFNCPSASPFDTLEMCGDGAGGLYLLSDDGSFTDPRPSEDDAELAVTVLRVSLDAGGNTTSSATLGRYTSETLHLACDGFSADHGGRIYLSEYHVVPDVGDCFRSDKESLVAVRKSNGSSQAVLPRLDAAEGLSDCDDIDNATHLEVSADGAQAFASFDSGGLWRVRPAPLQFLDSTFSDEDFGLHPDGSVIFTTLSDGPTTATLSVFKVSPAEVASGPLPYLGLTPCATFQLPNNRSFAGGTRRSGLAGLAVSPPAAGSREGTILVNLVTPTLVSQDPERCPEATQRIDNLTVRATIAFSSPADSGLCTPIGVINLERMDGLTF